MSNFHPNLSWDTVEADPFNKEAWDKLLAQAEETSDLKTIHLAYTRFLKAFPTCIVYNWQRLVDKKELPNIIEMDRWILYVDTIAFASYTTSHPDEVIPSSTFDSIKNSLLASMENAYEYVLKHIGQNLFAGPVWEEYIDFLYSLPTPNLKFLACQTMVLRRIFNKALSVPLFPQDLSNLWERYEKFENQISATSQNKSPTNMFIKMGLIQYRSSMKKSEQLVKDMHSVV